MPNCSSAAVLLMQVHHKIKIICDEEPSISLENVKNPAEECSYLRSYRVAACSFIKYKTLSLVFFHSLLQ